MEVELNHPCPICCKQFPQSELEIHANKCIFLTSTKQSTAKRKRSPSPMSSKEQPVKRQKNWPTAPTTPLLTQLVQPKSLQGFCGQEHVLGKNTFLRSLLDENEIPNMVLWGPPGCGKTTLGNIIGEICKKSGLYGYTSICAASCDVGEVRNVLAKVQKSSRRTVVFVDEIHTFNKKQQNIFLPHLIRGGLILVGATTENPSFALNNLLLNHCKVVVMDKLETCHLVLIIERTVRVLDIGIMDDRNTLRNMYQTKRLRIHRSAIKWLAETSDGDARIALNNLQLVLQHCGDKTLLTIADIKDEIKKSHLVYDRNGEEHHNIISAMHESIKGYDDNATLYWTTRMLVGGEDPLFIARRLVRTASEDTGNANPRALRLAVSTMHGCELVGRREAELLVAQCAVYLARGPTQKQVKSALALAKQVVNGCRQQQPEVPWHLRDLPGKLLNELGYKNLQNGALRSFMPAGLEDVDFL